jgi:hypothetical protein
MSHGYWNACASLGCIGWNAVTGSSDFATRHADTVIAHAKGIGAMKAYRDDVFQH